MSRRTLLSAAAALMLGIAGAAGYLWAQRNESAFAAVASADPSCDLQQGPCRASFNDGSSITLTLVPQPVRSLKPMQIQVQTEGLTAKGLAVDFRGLSMPMGYNRSLLQAESDSVFSGPGMLAACVLERMTWEATVLAETDQGVHAAAFVFETLQS